MPLKPLSLTGKTHRPEAQPDHLAIAMTVIIDSLRSIHCKDEEALHNFVTAWTDTALGRLGRIFAVDGDTDVSPNILKSDLLQEVIQRRAFMHADLSEDCLQYLFGAIGVSNQSLGKQLTQSGQSVEWREFFRGISHDHSVESALVGVRLAAVALASESVWETLQWLLDLSKQKLENVDPLLLDASYEVSMCVWRRWLLTLKVLAWLEDALQRPEPWVDVSAADLCCFGLAALLPHSQRPLIAVSHRSVDAKPKLFSGKAWQSNEVTLDATFMPVWQTNRAMVWSLFGSTPILCKIHSQRYEDSIWCRRESELFEHLIKRGDFMRGRYCVRLAVDEIPMIDDISLSASSTHRFYQLAKGIEAPPTEITLMPSWSGILIRAAAAARFLNRLMRVIAADEGHPSDAPAHQIANEYLEDFFHSDAPFPGKNTLLGRDDGWVRLRESLRDDANRLGLAGPLVTAKCEEDLAAARRWMQSLQQLYPNQAQDIDDPCDLLAALDFRDHLEPILRNEQRKFAQQRPAECD